MIHDGSKRTLCSYKKELKQMGIDFDPIWEEIKSMCAAMLKAYKPWIQYECLMEWGDISNKKIKPKAFHIVGFDIIIDSNLKPYLLEANGNPSLNIHFDPEDWKVKERTQNIVSEIDLYVKSKVLGDVVNMVKRNTKKVINQELDSWKTYEKIIDANIEENLYGHCKEYDDLLRIFIKLGGYKFFPMLTM